MMREVAAAVEGIDVLLLMADAIAMQPHADNLLLDRAKTFPWKSNSRPEQSGQASQNKTLAHSGCVPEGIPVLGDGAYLRS